jgi:hypothetical protein
MLFNDDFTSNPNQSKRWMIHRNQNDLTSEAVWRPSDGALYFTTAMRNVSAAVFATHELAARSWEARFRYLVNPGNGSTADGF